ncbi:MAG: hypothetical protein ACT4OT_14135 [Acidobacteriota bacterium]
MPSFAPKIRVEVYVPLRDHPAYQDTLTWLIDELTELCGGCTVHEGASFIDYDPTDESVGYCHSSAARTREGWA